MSKQVLENLNLLDSLLDSGKSFADLEIELPALLSCLRRVKYKGFSLMVDIFGIDYPEKPERIELVYIFLNMKLNRRLHLKLRVDPAKSYVPSACEIFKSANWFEREVFDMYGVRFTDHPDMSRILTDYEFEGHPMLKDFPLTGYKEVRYDFDSKEVVYDDVDLSQEYRTFDFLTPWEGTKYIDELSTSKVETKKE